MDTLIIPIISVVAIINFILSLIILSRGLKSFINILFALVSGSSFLWCLAIIGFYSSLFHDLLDWVRYTHIFGLMYALVFLYFCLAFTRNKFLRITYFISFISTVILCYFILFTNSVVGLSSGLEYKTGYLYYPYVVVFSTYVFLGLFALIKSHSKISNPTERKQTEYIIIGSLATAILSSFSDLILPAIEIYNYTWLGPLFTLILVVSIFIAILKYQLFNIKIILVEIFAALIILILLIQIFISRDSIQLVVNSTILVMVSVVSFFLVKGVYNEVSQREKIEELAKDLEKTNVSLGHANDRLKELDQMKSEFVSLATHQIRAPLTAIKGYISLIQEGDYGPVSKDVSGAMDIIFQSTNNLVTIVGDFLDVSRIEQGRMKFEYSDFKLSDLVEQIVTEYKPNIEKKGLELNYTFEQGKDYTVHADQGKIKQVIGNIIDNSVKYTQKGHVDVSVGVNDGKMRIKVSDTGVGIPRNTMPKLFQKFTRAENANEANILGTGLGLYVARQMIEAHHGRIWAESEGEGKGSQFYIELPKA